jgi:uncharacterized delta-60 repeat protein
VHAIAFQPDGKIVVGGDFMKVNGEARRRIARLNSSGDLDSSFNPRGALNREVRALLVQPDGKIVAGGGFDQTSGNRHNHVTRMNSDGKRDDSFNIGEGANGAVYCLALQSDGKLLVGGAFSRFGNTSSGHVTRLNADGSVDAGFKIGSGANAGVNDILLLPDGKILLAGGFTRFDGASCNRVVRLGPDGAVEGSFSVAAIPKGEVRCLAIQPGGKILVAGAFNSLAGMTRNGLARLNADGSLDQRFDTGQGATDGSLWSVAATKSGKVVIAGAFRDFNGTACGRITRLNGDVSATQKR